MKKTFLFVTIITLTALCACFFIFSFYYKGTNNSEAFPPRLNNGKRWKIGCFQSGESKNYNSSLKKFINHLAAKGWLSHVDWTNLSNESNTKDTWDFLAENMQSKYLQINKKYFWSSDWSLPKRKTIRKQVLKTLQNKEVDLMLAMGTWPGQDLANKQHSTPTLYLESSFPIKKLFKKGEKIPAHLYISQNPNFLLRQIRLFKKITKFKKLGVVYVASSEGRFRASLKLLKKFSKEENFKLIVIRILPHKKLNSKERLNAHVKAHEKIASQIDAMWLTSNFMDDPQTAGKVLAPFFKYKIPTWYPHGKQGVANGAVFGVVHNPDVKVKYYAGITAAIFNGAPPANHIKDLPVDNHLVINCAAAKKTDFKIPKTLLGVAKRSYLNINTGENQ